MTLDSTISEVQNKLRKGLFPNEAAVSNGALLPILNALGWPVFDTDVVSPEYAVEGRRVDYALRRPSGQPIVFLEVKRVGIAESGEGQLLEYAFRFGVPLAVLTDGQEWIFYWPAGEGHYRERRVYKLDLLERDLPECAYRLNRYLSHEDAASSVAFQNAQSDYRDRRRNLEIMQTLPQAWDTLLSESNDLLVETLADKVEDLCGYEPDAETCADFLASMAKNPVSNTASTQSSTTPESTSSPQRNDISPAVEPGDVPQIGFVLHGQRYSGRNAIGVYASVFEKLAENDPTFPERFASRKLGHKRRFLVQDKYALDLDREFCDKHSRQLKFGWFINTNLGNKHKLKIIQAACEVAGLEFGKDLIINLG